MKKVTDFNFYATCPSENGLQIRQARFIEFQIRDVEIMFRDKDTANFASSWEHTTVEIAGMGTFSGYTLSTKGIKLYFSFDGARTQRKNELVFTYDRYRVYPTQINLVPFEISEEDVIEAISQKAIPTYHASCYGNSYTSRCFVWDGTKPKSYDLWSLNKYIALDLLNNTTIIYTCQTNNPLRHKNFYKSAEDCAKDNHIEVFMFG